LRGAFYGIVEMLFDEKKIIEIFHEQKKAND